MYPKYDPKNPPPLWSIWIKNPFLDLVSKRNIRFRIKNPDLDFSKETHPSFFSKREKTCKLKKAQATSVDATSGTQGNGQIG